METEKLLSEEKYQEVKTKISKTSKIILIVGLLIGLLLITIGIIKKISVNNDFSEKKIQEQISNKKEDIKNKDNEIEEKKEQLNNTKAQLEKQIKPTKDEIKKLERVPFNGYNDEYYERKDKIDELKKQIEPIEEEISEISNYNRNAMCLHPKVTKEVCSLENEKKELEMELRQLENIDPEFEKNFNASKYIGYFMFGGFIIFTTLVIYLNITVFNKRREILAYSAQQILPLAKEGLEEITPTVTKARKQMIKEMVPIYKDIVKEVTKGVKEGLKDEEDNK